MDRRRLKFGRSLHLRNVEHLNGSRDVSPDLPSSTEAASKNSGQELESNREKSPVLSRSLESQKKRRSRPKSTPQERLVSTQKSFDESESSILIHGKNIFGSQSQFQWKDKSSDPPKQQSPEPTSSGLQRNVTKHRKISIAPTTQQISKRISTPATFEKSKDSTSKTKIQIRGSNSPEKRSPRRRTQSKGENVTKRRKLLDSDSELDSSPEAESRRRPSSSLSPKQKSSAKISPQTAIPATRETSKDSTSKMQLQIRTSKSPEKRSSGRSESKGDNITKRRKLLDSDSDLDSSPTPESRRRPSSSPSPKQKSLERSTRETGGQVPRHRKLFIEESTPGTSKLPSGVDINSPLKRQPIEKQKTPVMKQKENISDKRRRTAAVSPEYPEISDEDELFPVSSSRSRIPQRHVTGLPVEARLKNRLGSLLNEARITLVADDGPYLLGDDPPEIVQNLETLMNSKKYKEEEIIRLWNQHIEDTNNLQTTLNPTKLATEQEGESNDYSLVKILLHVPSLQTGIANALLERLTHTVLSADSGEDVPWSCLLLRQFRYLEEIVDHNFLTDKLRDLLEVAPEWFQRELISFLPEIIIDAQHHTVAEMLSKIMKDNPALTAVTLDCVTNLTLSKEYLEEHRDKALEVLKGNLQLSALPAIARFVLSECETPEVRQKSLLALRSVDMQQLPGEKLEDCFTNQVLTMNALSSAIKVSKQMADAALMVILNIKKSPKPFDLVMLLLVYSIGTAKKKNVENILRNRVRSGFYRPSLLNAFYNDYKEVARELQSPAISLASHLLKASDRVFANFAIDWFRLLFISQDDTIHKQREVLNKLILLMCANEQTAKHCLAVLSKMAGKDDERKYLQAHCNHLRILLDKVDDMRLEEVATLNDVLYGLCASSVSVSDVLEHDLKTLLDKQLSSVKPLTKCKGVLGAVMSIKHLAGKSETCKDAVERFNNVITNVKNCLRSRALFYDQMTEVIANTVKIEQRMLEAFTNHFQDELANSHLTYLKTYSGDKVSQFGLNTDEELEDEEPYAVNFDDGQDGAVVPILFRLVRMCYLRLHDGDVTSVDGLLGCPVFMPRDLYDSDPEPNVLNHIFHCINWFRETISGFVKLSSPVIQEKVLKRLDHLMALQGELSMSLAMSGSYYQPPQCYFHHFPAPPFVKIEKKPRKKGKKGKADLEKSKSLGEWELWEMGSVLSCKNPAYFRRLDTEVAHLLGFPMNIRLTQSSSKTITIAHVCFVIKELLGMLENEASETFMRDLVGLLPKVCEKLQQVAEDIREREEGQYLEGVRLLLCLLAAIFNWKGFHNAVHNGMLRDSLRTVASQINPENTMRITCKELVAESCKYLESLVDIATRISIAVALVYAYQALVQHYESRAESYKEKLAKMAYAFLCLDWQQDKHSGVPYRTAIGTLIKSWLSNEPDPLITVVMLLKWLPEEVSEIKTVQDSLARLPSINKSNFHLLFKEIFIRLIDGVRLSLAAVDTDPERIEVWRSVATGVQRAVQVCKALKLKANTLLFLRHIPSLMKIFVTEGIPILEHNLKYQKDEVMEIIYLMRDGQRYLHYICGYTRMKKDAVLAKHIPAAKSVLESLVFSVKAMLVLNRSMSAFTMGNLINKNLEGKEILSQATSSDGATTSSVSVSARASDITDDLLLEDLDTDSDEDGDESECH